MRQLKDLFEAIDWTTPAPALLVAVFFCLAALLRVLLQYEYRKWKRKRWARTQRSVGHLKRMSWQNFEKLAAEAFRADGWGVSENGGGGADGGVDLLLWRDGKHWVGQCKHYKGRVGAPVVREMVGVAVKKKAAGVVVVALNGFTKGAREYAGGMPVRLIDGPALLKMIQKSRQQKNT